LQIPLLGFVSGQKNRDVGLVRIRGGAERVDLQALINTLLPGNLISLRDSITFVMSF
jgi:hypothetical protein